MHRAQKSVDDVMFDVVPSSRRPRGAHVAVLLDGGISTHLLPKAGRVVLGRAAGCDVVIDHPSVSRRHAAIHVAPAMRLEDLGSSNGTRLAGATLVARRAVPLPHGALLEIGAALVLVQGPNSRDATAASHRADDDEAVWASDSPLARLSALFDLVAASDTHVVLVGEPGVGKHLAAERIHRRSLRAAFPLLRVDGTLPEDELERELFGDEAKQAPGLLERAHGGSLLLERVGDMALGAQVRLARALEGRRFARVGGSAMRPLDVSSAIASTGSRSRCRRSATAGWTCRCSPPPSWPAHVASSARPRCLSRATRFRRSRVTTSPATCASCGR